MGQTKQLGGMNRKLVDKTGDPIDETNPVPMNEVPPNDLNQLGDITVGTTVIKLAIPEEKIRLRFRANKFNTGIIYLGKSDVENDGTKDFARFEREDELEEFDYDNTTNFLYVRSDIADQVINVGVLKWV